MHYCLNHSAPVIISQGYTLSDFIKPSTQLHLHISYHRPPFACSRIIPAVFSFLRPHPLRRYLLLVTSSFVQLPLVKLFFPEDFLNSTGSQWFSAVSIWYCGNDLRFSEDCSRFIGRFSSCTLGNIFPFDASFCFFFAGSDVCGSSVLVDFVGWIFRCL